MTLDPNAKKAAYDAALPALNRNAAPFHVIDLAIEAYLAASRSSAIVEEPAGWKLVPVDPDGHMRRAGVDERDRPGSGAAVSKIYGAMLAAAPPSPQPHTGRAGVTDEMINAALNEKYGEVSIWSQLRVGVRSPFEIMRAALNAALTVEPEAGEVTVRPLAWNASDVAETVVGRYTIHLREEGVWWGLYGQMMSERYENTADAKAAANKDYTARIRSAIAP